jgi:hypothetical protein
LGCIRQWQNHQGYKSAAARHSQLFGEFESPPMYVLRRGNLSPSALARQSNSKTGAQKGCLPAVSPLELHSQRNRVIHKLRPRKRLWGRSVLNPLHHCGQNIMLGVKGDARRGRSAALANHPGSRPHVAVEHARDSEEAEELVHLGGGLVHAGGEMLVEAGRVEGGDLVVLLAVVDQDRAPRVLEAGQVGGIGADVEGVEVLGVVDVGQVEVGSHPGRVVVDDVFEPVVRVAERLSGVQLVDGHDLAARLHGGVDEPLVSDKVGEDLAQLVDLVGVEAVGRGAVLAEQSVGAEAAERRVLDDSVQDAVDAVALFQDLVVDQAGPSRRCDEVGGADGAGDGEEACSPGDEVVEVDGGGSGDNAVEIVGILFRGSDALSSTERASDVVGLVVLASVKLLDKLLANENRSMERSVSKVFDNVRVVVKCEAGGAVVAIVRSDSCEAICGGVGKIFVPDACEATLSVSPVRHE